MDWFALSDEEWTAIRLSLRVSAVAVFVSLPLGILVALALARGRFWGKSILNGVVHLPLILPADEAAEEILLAELALQGSDAVLARLGGEGERA